MKQIEIVIKGEVHTSRGDLEEERAILKEGVDHLILEGPEERNWRFKATQYWYAWILLIFEFLFARLIYVDKTILIDLAEMQDAKVQFTSASNTSILENSRFIIRAIAACLFFLLFSLSLLLGLTGRVLSGATLLLMSALLPLLLLRTHESRRAETGRDRHIAELIQEAAKDGGRIVVIVGDAHAKRIPDFLSNDLPEPDVRPPVYKPFSPPNVKELVYPGIVLCSVLYIVYSGILIYVRLII